MSAVACLTVLISTSVAHDANGGTPPGSAERYHPSAVRGQAIELEVQIPGVQHVEFEIDGMLEKLFDHEAPFNFLIDTAGLQKGKHEWQAGAYQEGCCVYGSTAGSIQIYPLPKVRAPVLAALPVPGEPRVRGLVVSKVARNLTVRAWALHGGPGHSTPLPLRLVHRHRSKRVYEFASGLTVNVGEGTEIDVQVAPAKRAVSHGVEVRGRLARLRLTRDRTGAAPGLQSAVSACTTSRGSKSGGPNALPKRQGCATAPPTPAVSIVCIKSMQCRPGAAQPGRRR